MKQTWMILDCNYLCHRAKHAQGGLSYKGESTGVIYGFLQNLETFQRLFSSTRFVFCFDSKSNKRRKLYPRYKSNRGLNIEQEENMTKEEMDSCLEQLELEVEFRQQIQQLRLTYLPQIGFKNILCQKGYEADDMMSSIVYSLVQSKETGVMITSDQDLYQMILPGFSFYNPQKKQTVTHKSFQSIYGIKPHDWRLVKAIAGCSSDCIAGVSGVGEKTALKYLKGLLPPESKAYQKITTLENISIFKRNLKLVSLPLKGCKQFSLQKDELSEKGWKDLMKQFGFDSLKNRFPLKLRKKKSG